MVEVESRIESHLMGVCVMDLHDDHGHMTSMSNLTSQLVSKLLLLKECLGHPAWKFKVGTISAQSHWVH